MINQNHDLGAALFKTWTDEQRRDEIGKLVTGFRSGLPAGILCKMAETIAGSPEQAREYLMEMLTLEELQAAMDKELPAMQSALKSFFL